MTSQSQKALDKGGRRKPASIHAKIRMQKRQKARNIRQLIDRVDYDKGAAISENHIRSGAFSARKKVDALDDKGYSIIAAGQYDYMPSKYEQGVRLGKTSDPRSSEKHRTVRAGIKTAIDETIRLRCAQIAAIKGQGLTADTVYRRRRKLCAAYLRGLGWTTDAAKDYVHADTADSDVHIRDILTDIVASAQKH